MQAKGFTIVEPGPYDLQIDIDSEEAWVEHEKLYAFFASRFDEHLTRRVVTSKSGLPHRHIYITNDNFSALSPTERIAWQAALGSDCFRELFSMFRVLYGIDKATIFLEAPA